MPLPLILLLLAGCPTADEVPPEGPAIDLGTGELEFEPLADGDELAIVQGSQGGYHLYGSFRVKNVVTGNARDLLEPTNPTMTFDIVHAGESLIASPPFTQGLDDAPEDAAPWTHQTLGREARMTLEFGEDGTLDGEPVDFSIRLEDAEGVTVEDSVRLVLFPHPLNGDNAPGR